MLTAYSAPLGVAISRTRKPASNALVTGLFFKSFEWSLSLEAPRRWLLSRFKEAGKVDTKKLDQTFWQAACRLVGMLHLIIQVRQVAEPWEGKSCH